MNDELVRVRVWDLPTRIFHWLLALCVFGSLGSAWVGGNAMAWHLRSGYAVFTLLLFRLLWGLFGGRWSRFSSFLYAPATSLRYLRGESRADEHHQVGHSPLGALSVFALLAILSAQVGTGLFADDEIATTGPLARFVADATSARLTHWHTRYGQWTIVALVLLHIGAVWFYVRRRRQDLLLPMLTGDKRLSAAVPASGDTSATRMLALASFAVAAGLVSWLVNLGA